MGQRGVAVLLEDDESMGDRLQTLERRIARGCLSRGVRSGRGDEVPRARATATASVRRELPTSRAGPGAEHTVVACLLGACRHSFVSYIKLLFIVLTIYWGELVRYSFTVNL